MASLGASWAVLGGVLGGSWAGLGASSGVLGHLGAFWEGLGAVLGRVAAVLARLERIGEVQGWEKGSQGCPRGIWRHGCSHMVLDGFGWFWGVRPGATAGVL